MFDAVLFIIEVLDKFNPPSTKIEQFIANAKLSDAVILKFTVALENAVCATGEFNVTAGATVSIVKFLIVVLAELFARSEQPIT